MRTNLLYLFFIIFLLQEQTILADELDYPSASSPLLLSLCTSFVSTSSSSALSASSSASSSSTEQFPPLPPHSPKHHHQHPPPTPSRYGGQPPNISRSLALLSRPGQFAQLSLFAGGNGNGTLGEEEWAKWMEQATSGQLRCSLRLEACPECLIELEWATPRTHFTDFQIQSLANCEAPATAGGDDLDLLLARASDHRPCFGLNFVEERADRPLPPNAESTVAAAAIFEPAYVFRRASIWGEGPSTENGEEATAETLGRFKSSGNSLLLVANIRHIGLDAQLGRWLRRLFPLRIRVLDNKVTVVAQPSNDPPSPSTNGNNNSSIANGPEGFIQSARFPAAYPRGIRQNLTILSATNRAVGEADARLRLQFDDFHLHYISELKIHDSEGRELFNSRREHRRPPALETRSPSLSILFSAREFTEPIGFRARYQLVNTAQEWADKPSAKSCDDLLDGFGGRIALEGQRHLLGEWVDCIWLIGRLSTGTPPAQQFDHLYLRVDQFHPRGQDLSLEVREGGNSQGRLLLQIDGEQSPKQLVQKQPEEGFTLAQASDAISPAAFYLRFQGRLESLSGLSILYAHFYRWPTALCPGGPDEFHCDNGKCIRASLRCDGWDHCGDSSDELCHFPTGGGGRLEDGDDMTQWPSSVLTIAFGVLTMFLLVLLLVLFASRTARRHLVPSPLGNLYSLQSVRRRLRQQPQRRQQCCGAPQNGGRREHRGGVEEGGEGRTEGSQRHHQQRGERGGGTNGGHSQQQGSRGDPRRNSSALATQLDFAVLNNLLGSAAANLGPSIQTLGERRFFVLPADQAPISVIEAPPTYQDALKHPKVTPRGSRRLIYPSDGPIHSPRRASQGNASSTASAAAAAYQNPAFRLSPTELLRMEMAERDEMRRNDGREERDGETAEMEELEEEEDFDVPQSPPSFRSAESTMRGSPPLEGPSSEGPPYPLERQTARSLQNPSEGQMECPLEESSARSRQSPSNVPMEGPLDGSMEGPSERHSEAHSGGQYARSRESPSQRSLEEQFEMQSARSCQSPNGRSPPDSPSQNSVGRFETIDLDAEGNGDDLDGDGGQEEHGNVGPSTSNGCRTSIPMTPHSLGQINLAISEEEIETNGKFPSKNGQGNGQIPGEECQNSSKNKGQNVIESAREEGKCESGTAKCQLPKSARQADERPDRMFPLRIRRPATNRRSTVPNGEE